MIRAKSKYLVQVPSPRLQVCCMIVVHVCMYVVDQVWSRPRSSTIHFSQLASGRPGG